MTKKKRELIEILLDNVKPEDWPDGLPYAAQDKKNGPLSLYVWFYKKEPSCTNLPTLSRWMETPMRNESQSSKIELPELCKNWNKTIVHRDEFMKRWNERNRVFVSITDQPPAVMDSAKYEALEFTEIGGDVEKTLRFSREGIDPVTVTEKMEKISIKPDADSEGWIQWNGGEMPVEKGTLIDVKYRDGSMTSEVFYTCDNEFRYSRNWCRLSSEKDIIAYRLHVPQEQKTPQQLALETFGIDWHENDGVQHVFDNAKIDVVLNISDEVKENIQACSLVWSKNDRNLFAIKKWRIHSDDKELQIDKAAESLSESIGKLNGVLPTAQQAFDGFKKVAEAMSGADIESIISDRGSNYGRFEDGAEIMQKLKLIAHTSQGWERMKPIQREGMDMILHKIGRILNGDPAYADSWVDIEGYSNLVSSWLKGESK